MAAADQNNEAPDETNQEVWLFDFNEAAYIRNNLKPTYVQKGQVLDPAKTHKVVWKKSSRFYYQI